MPLSDSAGSRLHNPIRSRAASYNQAKRGRGPAPFGVGAGRDIVYPRRSCERDLDCHGQPATARYAHTATLLPNGKVLVAGGLDSNFNHLASAELYDPASGTWTATGSLDTARYLSHGDVAAQRQGARRRGS